MSYTFEELALSKSVQQYKYSKSLIPGGTQLLSKRPEMFAPEVWPSLFSKAKGIEVWDLDDRKYLDMSLMSVGACVLGYADDEVDDAVISSIRSGVASSLNCPEDIELAELLIELHPWFQMARFTRSGGEAMSAAVRIARSHTKREKVVFSGYHGWTDWYISSNLANISSLDGQLMPGLEPNGVPRSLSGTALPFNANSLDSICQVIKGFENDIAAIVIEPARGQEAPKGYLNQLKQLSQEIGAVLIFDEITSGFRMCAGGIHRIYGCNPDMAVFAKSMANGYAMAAILGTETVMQSAQSSFISSTNWTERVGPSAALATIRKFLRDDVHKALISNGNHMKKIWAEAAAEFSLPIKISGLPSLPSFSFELNDSAELETLFTIEMLKYGFLAFRQFKPSNSHTESTLDLYAKFLKLAFSSLTEESFRSTLSTPIRHSGFYRLTKE